MTIKNKAVILAGGASRRFGEDKTRLIFQGKPLVQSVYQTLKQFGFDVFVSATLPGQFSDLGLLTIADHSPLGGPLQAIYSVLTQVSAEKILVVACDMPLLRKEVLEKLVCYSPDADIVFLESEGKIKMLPGIYSKRIIPIVSSLLEHGKKDLKSILQTSLDVRFLPKTVWRKMDPDFLSHLNVNRREDWDKIKTIEASL